MEFDAQARQAALGLLTDAEFAEKVAGLPFTSGQTVVGDSITDDLQGWLEILRHLLDIRGDAPRIVNQGVHERHGAAQARRAARAGPSRLGAVHAGQRRHVPRERPTPPKPEYQGPDGVHPSHAGQTATARALVESLSEVQSLP
jgi:hypothetical protein